MRSGETWLGGGHGGGRRFNCCCPGFQSCVLALAVAVSAASGFGMSPPSSDTLIWLAEEVVWTDGTPPAPPSAAAQCGASAAYGALALQPPSERSREAARALWQAERRRPSVSAAPLPPWNTLARSSVALLPASSGGTGSSTGSGTGGGGPPPSPPAATLRGAPGLLVSVPRAPLSLLVSAPAAVLGGILFLSFTAIWLTTAWRGGAPLLFVLFACPFIHAGCSMFALGVAPFTQSASLAVHPGGVQLERTSLSSSKFLACSLSHALALTLDDAHLLQHLWDVSSHMASNLAGGAAGGADNALGLCGGKPCRASERRAAKSGGRRHGGGRSGGRSSARDTRPGADSSPFGGDGTPSGAGASLAPWLAHECTFLSWADLFDDSIASPGTTSGPASGGRTSRLRGSRRAGGAAARAREALEESVAVEITHVVNGHESGQLSFAGRGGVVHAWGGGLMTVGELAAVREVVLAWAAAHRVGE